MFGGEALCFVFYGIQLYRAKRAAARAPINESDPLLSLPGSATPAGEQKKEAHPLIFWIPATLDLVGTTLGNIGLLWSMSLSPPLSLLLT